MLFEYPQAAQEIKPRTGARAPCQIGPRLGL